MKLSGSKKILLLGIILLIIAGIVVVALKGVKVSLILQQHEEINIYIGKPTNLKDMKDICKEVFGNKQVIVNDLDVFKDAYSISVESVTNEEKDELINKVNEKYGVEITLEDISEKTISNIRVRDIIRPYIKPVLISAILIAVYMIIRFRKENALKLLGKIAGIILLTEAVIFSVIAVLRIPLSAIMINIMAVIAVVELCTYIYKLESKTVIKAEKYK
ncbi:MAG: hypothetical protein IKL55_00510 [Clostridia bacterium]|nr:hypothetical protein [Clostridia bacterium]